MSLYRRVTEQMQAHGIVQSGDRILAAVSGGADSVCLLYMLAQYGREKDLCLRAAHIHHGLRESADRDCAFTVGLCRQLGIPCAVRRVDAGGYAAENGLGTEEAARILRYRALEEICLEWEEESPGPRVLIAAAHHREDQAETVLYRLCRGTGIAGAAGMRLRNGRIIRPLLHCTRQEIEEELHRRGSSWCTDETNEDICYARNRIRHEIMPALEEVHGGAGLHLAQFAAEAAQTEDYLAAQTAEALQRCLVSGDKAAAAGGQEAEERREGPEETLTLHRDGQPVAVLSVLRLRGEHPLIRGRVLYAALADACGSRKDLTAAHVDALLTLTERGGTGRLDLPCGLRAVKTGKWPLYLSPVTREAYDIRVMTPEASRALLAAEGTEGPGGSLRLPENQYTKWFDYDKISSLPALRTRQPGDRIGIGSPEGIRSKSLRRCMIDAGIPAPLRDRLVLPAVDGEILWIPGYRIHEAYRVTGATERILELRLRADSTDPRDSGENGETDE